jgi:excisionase family DNA binding protein
MKKSDRDSDTHTVAEAAARLGISAGAYYKGIARGELPAIRLTARRLVVPKVAIDRIISQKLVTPGSAA